MENNEISFKMVAVVLALIIVPVIILLVFNQLNKPNSKINDLLDKPAPEFSLQGRDITYNLEDLKGKNIVLFFNEGLACYPACWQQIAAFGTDQRFNNDDTIALSVVMDSPEDWQKTNQKMDGMDKANIVFDQDGKVSREYGMLSATSSMRPGLAPGHTYVIINKQGIVKYVLDDPSMAVRNDQMASELEQIN